MNKILSLSQPFTLKTLASASLIMTVFLTPLSSSGKSIALIVTLISLLAIPQYRQQLMTVLYKPWALAGIALFILCVIGCLWSAAPFSKQLFEIEKYAKLLYLPILVIGFSDKNVRVNAIHAFLAAMLLTSGLSILKFHGLLTALPFSPDHVFRNHIMTGLMMSFAAYLALFMASKQKETKKRLTYGCLCLLFTYQILFVNEGRTGYVMYLLMMSLLIIQLCTWKQAILGVVFLVSFFASCYMVSPQLQTRFDSIAHQFLGYRQHNEVEFNSALGLRLQFHDFARSLYSQHPMLGLGTAGFTHAFKELNPVPAWRHELQEPHSQYWFVAAEYGTVGFLLLLFFYYCLGKACWSLPTMKMIGTGLLVAFLFGNLTDSLLFYSGSGYFFLLFIAMCLSEQSDRSTFDQEAVTSS